MELAFCRLRALVLVCLLMALPSSGWATPRSERVVTFEAPPQGFPLVAQGKAAPILVDANDWPGVNRVAKDFQTDVETVTGVKAPLLSSPQPSATAVIIGTIGRSPLVDALITSGKLDVSDVRGRWESWVVQVIQQPLPGVDHAVVIAGSDKRGTIFGVYDLCEQIGVSPWHWWADVPAEPREAVYIKAARVVQGPPVVKYRGIFINDEEPAFGSWARARFGGVNSKMYRHVYELLLRLRGNYLWPAMWGKSHYEDDPESARLADEYGIVMGTSHHEPMMRAHQDWTKRRASIGNGQWNYATNRDGLRTFFQEGITRNAAHETLVTIGMRGDGDEPMASDSDMAANIALLETVVADQRKLLANTLGRNAEQVPQVWALYKEVADYYEHGMKVPDDVTLLWCDDNWGNLRRLPTEAEQRRAGGAGIYYHFDYVGSPRSYKWINTNPLPKIWQQMTLAAEHGATQVWVVNVGDLKPMELPTEFFLRLAWDPRSIAKEEIADWTRRWAAREFGPAQADAIASIVSDYAKYNAWRKPELLEPNTFSFVNYQEAESVAERWADLVTRTDAVRAQLPAAYLDAFYQLVEYPAKASATIAQLHLETGRNHLYAAQGRASALEAAARVRALFAADQDLTNRYHQLRNGKWRHMMAQTRIGYTSWSDPKTNVLPRLSESAVPNNSAIGVAIEGDVRAWPDSTEEARLPGFDSIGKQKRWIEVFRRGLQTSAFTLRASEPWVRMSHNEGTLAADQRIWIEIDWAKIAPGRQTAAITVSPTTGEPVVIHVSALQAGDRTEGGGAPFFGNYSDPIGIPAGRATANRPSPSARWEAIHDYGRGPSGMTVFPMTAPSATPPNDSPRLEYSVLVPDTGPCQVDVVVGVALDVLPQRGVRLAISFDDQEPQILDVFHGQRFDDPAQRPDKSAPTIRDWHLWVKNNSITLSSKHQLKHAGIHTLKIWMVDPGIVLEKIIVHTNPVRPSYFGPTDH